MAKFSDDAVFPCPHCGHEFTESLAKLKDDPLLTCRACGKRTKVGGGGTVMKGVGDLDELERAWITLTKGEYTRGSS
jgi:predicted nucleic acid-binding Zn ribbon protein